MNREKQDRIDEKYNKLLNDYKERNSGSEPSDAYRKILEKQAKEEVAKEDSKAMWKKIGARFAAIGLSVLAFIGIGSAIKKLDEGKGVEYGVTKEEPKEKNNEELTDKENQVENIVDEADRHQAFVQKYQQQKELDDEKTMEDLVKNKDENLNKMNSKLFIDDIITKYNNENGKNISPEDVAYAKTRPVFLFESQDGKLAYDYKEDPTFADETNVIHTDGLIPVYAIINKKDFEIIGTIAKIDNEVKNIKSNVLQILSEEGERIEYFHADKMIDITEMQFRTYTNDDKYNAVQGLADNYIITRNAKIKEIEDEQKEENKASFAAQAKINGFEIGD